MPRKIKKFLRFLLIAGVIYYLYTQPNLWQPIYQQYFQPLLSHPSLQKTVIHTSETSQKVLGTASQAFDDQWKKLNLETKLRQHVYTLLNQELQEKILKDTPLPDEN
jgi:hypothetical protein